MRCGKSINEQIESNSQRVDNTGRIGDSCGKSINEQIESNSQQLPVMYSILPGCGKSINEQIESNSQREIQRGRPGWAVAKVSMNKLKAIHNGNDLQARILQAVAKVSMNKLKAIHNN